MATSSKQLKNISLLLIAFHAVGLAGLLWHQTRNILSPLSPWIILCSFLLALFFQKPLSLKLLFLLAAIGVCGFFAEYAGVTTGWVFGEYSYGDVLGPGWRRVPFIIGITWCSLTYYTAQFKPGKWSNTVLLSAFAALLMTLYDFFLEPSAIRFGYWHWKNAEIPLQNYLAWFVLSFLFQLVLRRSGVPFKNKLAGNIFLIQLVFFALLALLPKLL